MSEAHADAQPQASALLSALDERPTLARYVGTARRLEQLDDDHPGLFTGRSVLVVRNFTVEPMEAYLKIEGFRAGIRLDIAYSGYDPTAEDLDARPDVVAVMMRLEEMAPSLFQDFGRIERSRAAEIADGVVDRVLALARGARAQTDAPVLVHNFVPPAWPATGLLDPQDPAGQLNLVRRINLDLAAGTAAVDGVHLVDIDRLFGRLGLDRCYDERSRRMSDAPYSQEALQALARWELRHIRALNGPRIKCLVVDCDNTLWGGVIGEDGLAGIDLGETGSGRAHRDFQQRLKDLQRRGVLLAITSKNEEADVLEVLRRHPDCILHEDDFAAMRVNWQDKATNLRSIAAEINLALEHLAFVDDDEFECGDVSARLPEVTVLRWPGDLDGPEGVDGPGLFDSLVLTAEDRERTVMYRTDSERRTAEAAASSPEEFLASLGLQATVGLAGDGHLARLAQLTQRTNQFNLTTRRYDLPQMQALAADPGTRVLWLDIEDRFGSHGTVGCGIVRRSPAQAGEALIDTFLLSCRVLGRRAEGVLANGLSRAARSLGCQVLVGDYIPTARNAQVADLYARLGFTGPEDTDGGTRWRRPLSAGDPEIPGWFKEVRAELDAQVDDERVLS